LVRPVACCQRGWEQLAHLQREFLQARFWGQKRLFKLGKHPFLGTYSRYFNMIAWSDQKSRPEIKAYQKKSDLLPPTGLLIIKEAKAKSAR
jgi:hypothetical protein